MKTFLIFVGAAIFWVIIYQFINVFGMNIQGLSYLEHIDMFKVF